MRWRFIRLNHIHLWSERWGNFEAAAANGYFHQTDVESAAVLVCVLRSGQHSFNGNIYNLRLWDYAMMVQQLSALSCDSVGNVIDWDNGHWDIPSSLAQTDATLSCSE